MKSVVYEDVKQVRVEEIDDPKIEEPGDAVVRVTMSAICGSDLHAYVGKHPLMSGDPMGHEGVGVVEEVGEGVSKVEPGDRVVIAFNIVCGECWFCEHGQQSLCDDFRNLGMGIIGGDLGGTQAERIRVPNADHNLLKIPDDVDDDRAVFLGDILTTGYYGAAIAGIRPGDTVAVIGAGPVGFFAAQAARLHDPADVLVLDMVPDRLALLERVGATPINIKEQNPQSAVFARTDGRGADVVIEAVGSPAALETSIDVVRRGGTICVMGMYVSEKFDLPLGLAWARMLTFRFGGICPVHAWWEGALDAVREGKIDPIPLVSHRLSLDEAPKGYELFEAREATKVVLTP